MPLNLYRRHRADCTGEHPEESRSGEMEERSKKWRRCDCQIFASGTLAGKFKRRRTGRWTWEEAKASAAEWERAGTWALPGVPVPATTEATPHGMTVAKATQAYIDSRVNRGISTPTLAKYRTLSKQLTAYCESLGYVMMSQLGVADMDRFYQSWGDGKRSKAKKLERLKGFIRFCLKRKWISENIAEDLEAPEGSSAPADKMPFTDAEMERIYAACDAVGGPVPPGPGHREWTGEDVKDFILLSIYTGLRISDVSTFDISRRLRGNDVYLRQHKTKKELWTWIPDWLVARLRERELKYGDLIFHDPANRKSTAMRNMSDVWRKKLDKVFAKAGQFVSRPTPHRLRYTFVRILLQNGVLIADVAELIGDTEAVVRRHYAKWVPERQERLTNILREAFSDKPRPGIVIEMPKAAAK